MGMDLGGWPAEMEKSLRQQQASRVPGHISYNFCLCWSRWYYFSAGFNMCAHASILRRAFEEISPSWPCNDDEVELIRAHLLQKLQE